MKYKAINLLEALNVRVIPYINGRLYDVRLCSYEGNVTWMVHNPTSVVPLESYGNDEAFAVMCPSTLVYNSTLLHVVSQLRSSFNVSGIYIDQIGAATPRLCVSPSHSHVPGDGSFWAHGYQNMLSNVEFPLVTESNAETYINFVDGMLTIANWVSIVGKPIWAFQYIYGGFFVSIGNIFSAVDFGRDGNLLEKLTSLFHFGSALTWMSLRGTSGVYEDLINCSNKFYVDYMLLLQLYRSISVEYFTAGYRIQNAQLQCTSSAELQQSVWMLQANRSQLAIFISRTSNISSAVLCNVTLDSLPPSAFWLVYNVTQHGQRELLKQVNSSCEVSFKTKFNSLSFIEVIGKQSYLYHTK